MPWLNPSPGRGCGAHEFASDPYVQSCSETEQDVHGLLPSHLQVEYDQYPVLPENTPHQPRLDTVASCSGDPNLILRARQMSHCQRGQPLTSLCKTERGMAVKSRHGGLTAWDVLSLFLAGCSDRSDDGATSLSSSIDTARSGRCVGWGAGSEQNVCHATSRCFWAKYRPVV